MFNKLGNFFQSKKSEFSEEYVYKLLENYSPISNKVEVNTKIKKNKGLNQYQSRIDVNLGSISNNHLILADQLWCKDFDIIYTPQEEIKTKLDFSNSADLIRSYGNFINHLKFHPTLWGSLIVKNQNKINDSLQIGNEFVDKDKFHIYLETNDLTPSKVIDIVDNILKYDFVDVKVYFDIPPSGVKDCPYRLNLSKQSKTQKIDVGGARNKFGFYFDWLTVIPKPELRERSKVDMNGNFIRDKVTFMPEQEHYNPFPDEDILLKAPVYKSEQLPNGSILWQLTPDLDPMSDSPEFTEAWIKLYRYLEENMVR